jgi:multidrug efflux pump subunit AcrB
LSATSPQATSRRRSASITTCSAFNTRTPKVYADIDRVRAEMLGVTANRVFETLQDRITLPSYVSNKIAAALCSFEQQQHDEVLKEFVRPFLQPQS